MKLTFLALAVALLIGSIPTMASSVFVTTDEKALSTPYDTTIVTETVNYFTNKGYTVADSIEKADYVITCQLVRNDSSKQFNIVGCLLCGAIVGAFQVESKVTLSGTITQNKAQIWSSVEKSSDKGWFLFGILQNTSSVVRGTIKTGVSDLFDGFMIQKNK